MNFSSYTTFDHTNQGKEKKRINGKSIQYVFYHTRQTVPADFNIYLLGKKSDISKKENDITFCCLFCKFGLHFRFLSFFLSFSPLILSFLSFYHSKKKKEKSFCFKKGLSFYF
jgi:hypothetical protein